MIKMKKSTVWLTGGLLLAICAILQVFVIYRYITRLPDDTIGIILYVITAVCFAVASIGFLINSKKEKMQ